VRDGHARSWSRRTSPSVRVGVITTEVRARRPTAAHARALRAHSARAEPAHAANAERPHMTPTPAYRTLSRGNRLVVGARRQRARLIHAMTLPTGRLLRACGDRLSPSALYKVSPINRGDTRSLRRVDDVMCAATKKALNRGMVMGSPEMSTASKELLMKQVTSKPCRHEPLRPRPLWFKPWSQALLCRALRA
jgi:hypothetical protein